MSCYEVYIKFITLVKFSLTRKYTPRGKRIQTPGVQIVLKGSSDLHACFSIVSPQVRNDYVMQE